MEEIPNLHELQSIKSRLEELRHSLNTFSIHPETSWPDMLEKFNVLSGKYYNLAQLIHSPSLRNIALHPVTATQEQPELIPNVLLRTRLDPRIRRGTRRPNETSGFERSSDDSRRKSTHETFGRWTSET